VRTDTSKGHRAHVIEVAAKDFVSHIITTVTDTPHVKVFYCGRADTRIGSFYLSVLPGAILVHGDIGDLLIDHPSGGLDWLLDSADDLTYLLSKSYVTKLDEFMPGDAEALLADENWLTQEERDAIRARWVRDMDDRFGTDWREIVHDVTGDSELSSGSCLDYGFRPLYCIEAIRWFARNYKPAEVAA
jgi:hypothetical protein